MIIEKYLDEGEVIEIQIKIEQLEVDIEIDEMIIEIDDEIFKTSPQ